MNKTTITDELEPMMPDHFRSAVARMKFRNADVVKAAFKVACEGMRPIDAAAKFDTKETQITRAVSDIREKWKEIHEKMGLVCYSFALTPEEAALVENIEKTRINPMTDKKREGWEKYGIGEDFEE